MCDIKYLETVALLDNTELGEVLSTLLSLYRREDYLLRETVTAIKNELKAAESFYKETYTIVDKTETSEYNYKALEENV